MTAQTIRKSRAFWAGVAFFAGVLGTAFTGGMQASEVMRSYASAQQVSALADTAARHSVRINALEAVQIDTARKLDRVLCYVEALAEDRSAGAECIR